MYISSGTRVNSLLDNPCLTLSNAGSYTSWVADFTNSRCSRTILNDSGWKIQTIFSGIGRYTVEDVGGGQYNFDYEKELCTVYNTSSSCTKNGYTYHMGSLYSYPYYYVKRTYISTEYKFFSNF